MAGQFQRHLSSTSSEDSTRGGGGSMNGSCTPPTAKEYVMSLHQNDRSVLLYGKNNVSVQPVRSTLSLSLSLILPRITTARVLAIQAEAIVRTRKTWPQATKRRN